VKRIDDDLNKLVDLALTKTLERATIKGRETSLLAARAKAIEELEEAEDKRRSMPDINKVRQEAELVRRQLLEHFSSQDHLLKMGFDEKQELLHWLFDGKDKDGKPYGIYVSRRGRGHGKKVDYFMYGRLTGLRTLKGDDINYQHWDENEGNYKTDYIAGK
jgi:hypothetical protein